MSKGHRPRPRMVTDAEYSLRWDLALGKITKGEYDLNMEAIKNLETNKYTEFQHWPLRYQKLAVEIGWRNFQMFNGCMGWLDNSADFIGGFIYRLKKQSRKFL